MNQLFEFDLGEDPNFDQNSSHQLSEFDQNSLFRMQSYSGNNEDRSTALVRIR